MVVYIAASFLAYVLRLVYSRKALHWLDATIDSIAAISSGAFAGGIMSIYPAVPFAAQIAICALAGFIGPDLVMGLLSIFRVFKEAPDQFILKYIYAFRGIKNGMDMPEPGESKVNSFPNIPNSPKAD